MSINQNFISHSPPLNCAHRLIYLDHSYIVILGGTHRCQFEEEKELTLDLYLQTFVGKYQISSKISDPYIVVPPSMNIFQPYMRENTGKQILNLKMAISQALRPC